MADPDLFLLGRMLVQCGDLGSWSTNLDPPLEKKFDSESKKTKRSLHKTITIGTLFCPNIEL